MGDDAVDAVFYTISSLTGEKILMEEIKELPSIAPGGEEFENIIFEEFIGEAEFEIVKPKAITNKIILFIIT